MRVSPDKLVQFVAKSLSYFYFFQLARVLLGGAQPKLKIPDYKIYQVNHNTPELLKLQEKLAAKGLKDPWIRNEVWRFDERDRIYSSKYTMFAVYFMRGIPSGIILGFLCAVVWWTYDKQVLAPKHHHGDHH